ncbi:MAG: C10 family peptidase [Bacteroidales bacterium]
MKIFRPAALITSGILWTLSLHCQNVSRETAENISANFFYERCSLKKAVAHRDIHPLLYKTLYQQGTPVMYVFNIKGGGFVIVPATRLSAPVLAYSFNGNIDLSDPPPAFSGWLDSYARQIHYQIHHPVPQTQERKAAWSRLKSKGPEGLSVFSGREVEPLLTTTWDQGLYYNEMCPPDNGGPGGHCYAGCVATAMGGVMNYFRFPPSGTGAYSYSCPPYGTLSANFGNSVYSWDEMPLFLIKSNPPTAQLLNHLGISVDMVYGPNGSGMYNHKAAFSLRTYFKYSPETQYVYRDSTGMDWDSLLVSHLNRDIPLYYAGWSVPNVSGHAFVCDGYQDPDYYHFNWGWSGSFNGYFYTDNLNPGGSNFNNAQEVIINAVPDTNLYTYPYSCQGLKTLTSTDGTIDDGSGPLYDYADNLSCEWLIDPEDSVETITLSFVKFSTGIQDILTVYDGADASAPAIGTFSGNEIPGDLTSTGGKLFLTFETGTATSHSGWLASWSSELPVYCSGMNVLNQPADTLSDGSGPENYHNNSACMWRIDPPDATSLTLEFLSFHTEDSVDVVKVYDLETQELLAAYSGDYSGGPLPGPVTSPSGKMFVTFHSNYTVTAPGWKACYRSGNVGLEQSADASGIEVYPNPAKNTCFIELFSPEPRHVNLQLLSLNGSLIRERLHTTTAGKNTVAFHTEGITKGLYILKITGQTTQFKKILIY